MSETREVIIEKGSSNDGGNVDAFDYPHEEPAILHTKKFRIGSGNIIGKGVIQDFFTCVGALPTMGGSILHRTSSLVDAISLLAKNLLIWIHLKCSTWIIFDPYALVLKPQLA